MSTLKKDNEKKVNGDASEEQELYGPQDNLRPQNRYLTALSDADDDYCVVECNFHSGTIVPLHIHSSDRETFYVVSGEIEGYNNDHWEVFRSGDVFDVVGETKHGWRNVSGKDALIIFTTTMRMGRFLRDISNPAKAGVTPEEQATYFAQLIQEHGYWLASPEENAAAGLVINWG